MIKPSNEQKIEGEGGPGGKRSRGGGGGRKGEKTIREGKRSVGGVQKLGGKKAKHVLRGPTGGRTRNAGTAKILRLCKRTTTRKEHKDPPEMHKKKTPGAPLEDFFSS